MLTLEGPGEGVEWVSWHPKGHAVCAGSQDGTAWMWWAGKSSGGGNVMQVGGRVSVTRHEIDMILGRSLLELMELL